MSGNLLFFLLELDPLLELLDGHVPGLGLVGRQLLGEADLHRQAALGHLGQLGRAGLQVLEEEKEGTKIYFQRLISENRFIDDKNLVQGLSSLQSIFT